MMRFLFEKSNETLSLKRINYRKTNFQLQTVSSKLELISLTYCLLHNFLVTNNKNYTVGDLEKLFLGTKEVAEICDYFNSPAGIVE